MSPPLENTSPCPRTTTQRTESSSAIARKVAISSRCIASSIALRATGFDRLTHKMAPSPERSSTTRVRFSGSAKGTSPGRSPFRQHETLRRFVEHHFKRHAVAQFGKIALDDVGDHLRPFGQLYDCQRVG